MSEQSLPTPITCRQQRVLSHVANFRPSGFLKPGRAEEQSESHQGSALSWPAGDSYLLSSGTRDWFSWGNFSTKHLTEVLLSRLWVDILSGFAFVHKTPQPPPCSVYARSSSKSGEGNSSRNTILFCL